jgi:hypothetical protein
MSSSRLIRLGGLAAMVGFALYTVVAFVLFFSMPENEALSVASTSTFWFVTHLLWIIAMLLGLLGLLGIYARQAKKIGVLGLIAFLMAFFGWALYSAWEWSETFIWPVVAHVAPQFVDHPDQKLLMTFNASQTIHWLLFGAGLTLFGVVSLRAGVLPRGAAVLLIVGGVATFVGNGVGLPIPEDNILGILVTLVGMLVLPRLAWMGYAVWLQPPAAAEVTTPVTADRPSVANR